MQAKLRHDGVTLSSICRLYGCFYKHLSSLTLKTNRFVTRSIGNIVNWTNGCFQMLVDCGNLPVTQVKEKHVDEWKHINCSLICRDLCFLPVCVRKNWLFLSLLIMRFILFSVKYETQGSATWTNTNSWSNPLMRPNYYHVCPSHMNIKLQLLYGWFSITITNTH